MSHFYLCPVCGLHLEDEPWHDDGPSDTICPCCGTQFGYHDLRPTAAERKSRHEELRANWISNGMLWHGADDDCLKPPDWNPSAQLSALLRLKK